MITLRANHSTTIGWVKIRQLGQPEIKQTSSLGPVPERPISANLGLRSCSTFCIYLAMHFLEKHFV